MLGDNSARFAMHFGGNRCILGQFHRVGLAAFVLLQHASPRSLEVPQGTFYCKSRCGGRENKVDFPERSALAFLPGPRARPLDSWLRYVGSARVLYIFVRQEPQKLRSLRVRFG